MISLQDIEHCPICGNTQRDVLYSSNYQFDPRSPVPSPYSAHYQINRCAGCDLIFSGPVLNEEGVKALYRYGSETNAAPSEETNVRATMAGYYDLARPYLTARQRFLDIGCDIGMLLEVAEADGFSEIHGIEVVPAARERALQAVAATISDKFYEETIYPAHHFDLITFIHVLDHLIDPSIAVKKAFEDVRPGGLVVAVVHNVECLLARLLGERFPVFNLYHHYFFSKSTLARLFEAYGFEVIKVVDTRNQYSLGFFAERAPGLPTSVGKFVSGTLRRLGLARLPLSMSLGNIGIVARRSSRSPVTS